MARTFPSSDFQTKERMIVHYFVQAIREQSLRMHVKRVAPTSLEEAINIVMREESICFQISIFSFW
mgnify:CR=1 FL=1